MVGGTVINTVCLDEEVWVQCQDRKDTCAIRVKANEHSRSIKPGDKIWWQGRRALWTPMPLDGRVEIVLTRTGYSHNHIPEDVFTKVVL